MSNQIEENVNKLMKPYEERMLLDVAADLFDDHSVNDVIRLSDFLSFFPDEFGFSKSASRQVFQLFDQDKSGTIDASEFLHIIRYLNFGSGYCDGCDVPIQENGVGFLCQSCDGYILCPNCYMKSDSIHSPQHRFVKTTKARKQDDPLGLPPSVGKFLRGHVMTLFEAMDADGSGVITFDEFIKYFIKDGLPERYVRFMLQFDLDGDGTISHRELLFLIVALATVRGCDECGDLVFIGSRPMVCCVECIADYDVCGTCMDAGKVTHRHENFRPVSLFDLRHAGLCYEYSGRGSDWNLTDVDRAKWHMFKPFIESELCTTVAFGPPSAKPHVDRTHALTRDHKNSRMSAVVGIAARGVASFAMDQAFDYVVESGIADAVGEILLSLFA